jgi:2-hydroxy-6-oxonona-2,4-dienedioate hydrolase
MTAIRENEPLYNQAYLNVGKGETLLLLNGLFGNITMWQPLIEHLKATYQIIVPRLPIFDLPPKYTNLKYLVKVLHEFIEWNQLSNITIVGHAVGGQLGLLYAHQHPEKVDRLVLISSAGLFDYAPPEHIIEQQHIDYEFVSKKVQDAFHGKPKEATKLAQEIYLNVLNIPKRMALSSIVKSSLQSSVSSFLSDLEIPIQLIWGLQDKISPPEVALHFHDLLKHGQLKFIDQCGHLPMIEQSHKLNNIIEDFLKGRNND